MVDGTAALSRTTDDVLGIAPVARPMALRPWYSTSTTIEPIAMPLNVHIGKRELEVGDADDHDDGGGHDVERLAEVDLVVHPDLHADHADHAVEQRRDAAEHTGGNRVDDLAELGAQREDEGEAAAHQYAAVE